MNSPPLAAPSTANVIQREFDESLHGSEYIRALLCGLDRISRAENRPRNSEELVHALRVRSKRLRALLELLRDGMPDSFYRSQKRLVRSAARRLSRSRDSAVVCREIAACAHSLPRRKRRKAQPFLRAVREERQSQEPGPVEQSTRELKIASGRFASAPMGQLELALPLKRSYRHARCGMRASRKSQASKSFHYWRKWAKRLQLELQLLRAAGLLRDSGLYPALDILQQQLGHHRDLLLAGKYLSDKKATKPLLKRVRHTRSDLEKKLLRSARKIFALKPRKFVAELFTEAAKATGAKSKIR